MENLQPTGSFKVRGAGNALLAMKRSRLKDGVWIASAGNMGQALAAALKQAPGKKVVCIVSGGNISIGHLTTILRGDMP